MANSSPPITARPSGAFCSPPSPKPSAIGTMPIIIASAVMSTGRMRVYPAATAALNAGMPSSICSRAKLTIRILLAVATPMHITAPVSDGTFNVVCVSNRNQQIPASAPGKRRNDDERIKPRLEIHHDQQIHQHNRASQPHAPAQRRTIHGRDLPAHDYVSAARQLFVEALQDLVRVRGHAAQIAILRAGVNVDDWLHVVMVHRRSPDRWRDLHQISHQLRTLLRDHRNVHQVVQVSHTVLRRLHGDLIRDPILAG